MIWIKSEGVELVNLSFATAIRFNRVIPGVNDNWRVVVDAADQEWIEIFRGLTKEQASEMVRKLKGELIRCGVYFVHISAPANVPGTTNANAPE